MPLPPPVTNAVVHVSGTTVIPRSRSVGATPPACGQRAGLGSGDMIYNGDAAKWRKFSNGLRLRLAMRMQKADPAKATAEIAAAIGELVDGGKAAAPRQAAQLLAKHNHFAEPLPACVTAEQVLLAARAGAHRVGLPAVSPAPASRPRAALSKPFMPLAVPAARWAPGEPARAARAARSTTSACASCPPSRPQGASREPGAGRVGS